jgi:hypothetical protein
MADSMAHLEMRTRVEWLASLSTEYQPKKIHRRTSIICTIGTVPLEAGRLEILTFVQGPKTNSPEKITMLRKGKGAPHGY